MRLPLRILAIALTIVLISPPRLMAQPINAIQPNENLVVEGIPTIPTSLAERVDRYTQFRAANLSTWHPTQREMLISTRFADVAQVHQVQMPIGARQQLTFFPERVSGASYQPTDGKYFVFSKDIGGNEFAQNYRYELATGDVTLLTDGKSKNGRGSWSSQGDRMVYSSTRRTGKDTDFYIIDPLKPESNRLLCENPGGGWGLLDWSPDDTQILAIEYVSINESYLWSIDAKSGAKTLITPKNQPPKGQSPTVSYGGAQFSHDGKGLYLVADRGSEFQPSRRMKMGRVCCM
jgi:Tol biopolymer transport system component